MFGLSHVAHLSAKGGGDVGASARICLPNIMLHGDQHPFVCRATIIQGCFGRSSHRGASLEQPEFRIFIISEKSSILNFFPSFNGWGVTTVDSLDTMYMMGLHKEFDRGVKLVKKMQIKSHNVGGISDVTFPPLTFD